MRIAMAAMLLLTACEQGATKSGQPQSRVVAQEGDVTPAGWEARLTEMLPFIDACIGRSPGTRAVSFAAPTGEGLVTVRLSGADGDVDCSVPQDDPTPTYAVITPRRAESRPSGEGAVFVRGPGENPGGECYAAPEVRDASGQVVGWMLDPEGC